MGVINRLIRVETITVILNFSCFGSLKYGEEDRKKNRILRRKHGEAILQKQYLLSKKMNLEEKINANFFDIHIEEYKNKVQ